MGKLTEGEVELRVSKIVKLMITGHTYQDLVRFSADSWKVCTRTVDNYIKRAKIKIQEYSKETQKEWLHKSKIRFEELYKRSLKKKDLAECRKIIETANKVLGYEKLNLNMSGSITIDDLRKLRENCYGNNKHNGETKISTKRTSKPKV